jgi:hypothetical protein
MRKKLLLTVWLPGLALLSASEGHAQPAPARPPVFFDVLGFIQDATLDLTGAVTGCVPTHPRLAGGTVKVNGLTMIVPCNTIVQFPATSMSWADVFDPASSAPVSPLAPVAPPTAGQTGLALDDLPAPFPSFEVHVQGNMVTSSTGVPRYIVGLIVPVAQQGLNAGAGFITAIDNNTGVITVGGGLGVPGALLQVNDPEGVYGNPHSPDPRFTSDTGNPTISALTGVPMCVPRFVPPAEDPLCPARNRPLDASGAPLTRFTMLAPSIADTGKFPNPKRMVPFAVGDWVTFSGTLFKAPPGSPSPTYLSVHTMTANVGIFTAAGTSPAYVRVEEMLVGTGPSTPPAGVEATTRQTFVGFATDPTSPVRIEALVANPCTGLVTPVILGGSSAVGTTTPVAGRFVQRLLSGAVLPATSTTPAVVPTRLYRVSVLDVLPGNVLRPRAQFQLPSTSILAGQYTLPNFAYIFPETTTLGAPVFPANFEALPFLVKGDGPLDGPEAGGPLVGQLNPWPLGTVAPPAPVGPCPKGAACTLGTDCATGVCLSTGLCQ